MKHRDEVRAHAGSEGAPSYEPPKIAWREPYQPMSFGVSCAKQPGNPGCAPGPLRK